ncbi:nucleotide-sugar transporter [Chloropicon primus]|uniref:Nucleotide-sugar transporter n=1 Tax=Chloropicon primus TaxID=1764295 RepID=A0A5B8MYS5_9CHLO|nr:nucleotide-sugar transporter [Chloropicon primus]UPR04895.1 nucleotide-sugar transporter [Chloropicon primus]|eukprot:QDZ25699.1 nucleotide-sugar transporter [Chloropicon primus]
MSQISVTQKLIVAGMLTCLTSSQGLLMTASKVGGKYPYNVATIPLLAEFCKLLVSSAFLYKEYKEKGRNLQITKAWSSVRLFPIPSIIYLFHNNVQFYTMAYVDAATYQILGNLKIITTGFLFWIALKRYLSRNQWLALSLLTLGAAVSQISGCGNNMLSAPVLGYLFACLSAVLSALAGVYTEFLLKKNNDTLYWQNVQLYGFGTLFNAARLTYDDIQSPDSSFWLFDLTDGYNYITWLIVINFSFSGLFISWIQKYANTIVKVYATSSAMMVTAFLSIFFFDLEPTLQLFLGIAIVCTSIMLYFMPGDLPSSTSLASATSGSKMLGAGSNEHDEEYGKLK